MTQKKGFTLVEVVVGVSILLLIVSAAFAAYRVLHVSINASKVKLVATNLVSQRFELLRSLPYESVLEGSELITINNLEFEVTTEILETDHKLVEVEVACALCRNFEPIKVVSLFFQHNE